MVPMMYGSLEQAAHMLSNLFPEVFVFWRRHAGRCIAVERMTQGIVEDVEAQQRSFGLNNYLTDSGFKCKYLVWQEDFKGIDAKIMVCVFPVRRDSEDLVRYEDCS